MAFSTSPAPGASALRRWVHASALALVGLFVSGCGFDNFHEVDEGRFFRSAQLEGHELRRYIQEHGIRTVINLRGESVGDSWYEREVRVCEQLEVQHIDVRMSARRIPHRHSLLSLLELYDRAELPILIHCKGGADRTGLAAALWCVEYMQMSLGDAVDAQLNKRFLHFEFFYPAKTYFMRLYQGREWAIAEYDPCSALYDFYDREKYCP